MRRDFTLLLSVALMTLSACHAGAADWAELGYCEDTIVSEGQSDLCDGQLVYNHDYRIDNAYCFQYEMISPPHYGAFGEGIDVGVERNTVECGVYWFSQSGSYSGQPMDAYVWEGGVSGPPGAVLCLVPHTDGLDIPYWPVCALNQIEIGCRVEGEFTVGYWADFSGGPCAWYCCADENGFGGYPWICVAPGMGYPTGWQSATVLFDDCTSLCIGAMFSDLPVDDEDQPRGSPTWGGMKALFR